MFFELSARKLSLLFVFAASLVLVVAISFAILSMESVAAGRGVDFLSREQSALSYLAFFKIPGEAGSLLAAAAGLSSVTPTPAATTTAESIPVLLYHGEGASASTMPTSVFVDQMRALKAAGWQTVTLAQFESWMQGKTTLPARSFLLTFDDGRSDTFYSADPVLKDLDYTAVMFVITGFSMPGNADAPESSFYLSKNQLAYMQASGRWDLESHGDEDHRAYTVPEASSTPSDLLTESGGHFLSNKFWVDSADRFETTAEYSTRVTDDLSTAKSLLETDFNKTVTAFAYPFNDFGEDSVNFPASQAILNQIVPSIYRYAFYQTWPGNGDTFNYPNANASTVKRFEPQSDWSGADLLAVLEGGEPKSLPYSAASFGSDWQDDWGTVAAGSELTLAAASSTTGAAAFLDGTESWTNYAVRASAMLEAGTFSLAARHGEDETPYYVCAFSDSRIYLERHTLDAQTTLASAPYAPPALPATLTVSMQVVGNEATCSAYGVSVAGGAVGVASHGQVGATVWDPEEGTARVAITHFSVSPL